MFIKVLKQRKPKWVQCHTKQMQHSGRWSSVSLQIRFDRKHQKTILIWQEKPRRDTPKRCLPARRLSEETLRRMQPARKSLAVTQLKDTNFRNRLSPWTTWTPTCERKPRHESSWQVRPPREAPPRSARNSLADKQTPPRSARNSLAMKHQQHLRNYFARISCIVFWLHLHGERNEGIVFQTVALMP